MRDFSNPRVFIFSAHRANATKQANDAATAELACDLALEGFPFTECLGYFEGNTEQCFLVKGSDAQETVERLALAYEQDSVLLVAEHDRAAYLVDTDTGFHRHIGTLVCVGDQLPEDAKAWTRVDGLYFTTVIKGRLTHLPRGL